MKKILLMAALAGVLFSCQKKADSGAAANVWPNQQLITMFETYWDQNLRFFPLEATAQGDNRYNHLLPNDNTQAFRDSLQTFYQQHLDKLHQFDRASLNANDQISYDIFEYELETRLEGLKLNTWMIPFQQFWGLPLTMGQLGAGTGNQPFKTTKDYENWLGRVQGFTVWADSAIANFRQGMAAGVVLPRPLVVKMIPQMQSMVVSDPTKSLFYGPIQNFPGEVPAADRQRLTQAYQQAISTQLVPAYQKLATFLQQEYLPKARTTTGINDVPGGKDLYTYYVKYWTTTDKAPDEIYKTGQQEVKRITAEMQKVKDQVGFRGNMEQFFTYLRTNPRFTPYKTPEEVLNAFRSIQAKIEPNLQKMFGRTPKTPFEIRQTEAFRAASASAEYNQGSPDGTRPGIFYLPILDATKFNTTSGMESLFLHEAIPGHHYQISLQQENENLPKFRRFSWYGAYGEGWALYTESLGKELGLYTDPYQYMGALGDEMHRAIRLVVDVGMHTKGMTRGEAIQYMMANEAISEEGAIAEIERYMAIPGQALSYKTGQLKIKELREKYEKELGDQFKLAAFHDEFLKDGTMPLRLVEKKMDDWAKQQKK
ncbi:DUF885 family protein [Rufibacter glacialis]|uniref:DUF885 domain-containing protein n=1 Tax=Rufibacter glacialis TaxID=1259555 RepID=A0A5M8Q7G3_9BACT|nr:DUF885 domain-containing protein [Rufibacter glacialis]KAA6431827.1 DUF885 domain-containing protein [Rufibacter glacialis]GGK81264.1 hypothetical protein GCM10011405_31260 [Rufibacter glacialis]